MRGILFVGLLALGVISTGCSTDLNEAATQTESLLQLQSSNKAASSIGQPSTPTERDLSLQRWLNSYQHAIPEYYEQKKGGSISGGGGSGG